MFTRRMLFAISLAGTFIFVVPVAGQEPTASQREIEIIQSGTVHVFPSTLYDTIGRVDAGQRYTVLARSGSDWYKIDFHGQAGYIAKALTKLAPRVATPVQKPGPQPPAMAAPARTATTGPVPTQSQAPRTAKPAQKAAAVEAEVTVPVDTLSTVQVSSDAVPVEVSAQSGSHAMTYLLVGGVAFLIVILVMVHFLRPEESAEEFLHHRTS